MPPKIQIHRRNFLQTISSALVIIPLTSLVSCSTTSLITAISLVADAAQVALPIVLSAVGIPAPLTSIVMGYIAAVAQGVSQAGTLIMSGPLTPQLVAQIVALFAMIAKPVLPPGLPAVVAGVIDDLANKLASFLGQLETAVPPPAPAGAKIVLGPGKPVHLHGRDRKAIADVIDKSNQVVQKIRSAGY